MREGLSLNGLKIEARQHSFLGMDLGEGVVRSQLLFVLGVLIVWIGGLLLLFGLPRHPQLAGIYIVPPVLVAAYGWMPDRSGRRRKISHWLRKVAWLTSGHQPIVAGGRASGDPMTFRTRWWWLTGHDPLKWIAPRRAQDNPVDPDARRATGLRSAPTVQLISDAVLQQMLLRRYRRPPS